MYLTLGGNCRKKGQFKDSFYCRGSCCCTLAAMIRNLHNVSAKWSQSMLDEEIKKSLCLCKRCVLFCFVFNSGQFYFLRMLSHA